MWVCVLFASEDLPCRDVLIYRSVGSGRWGGEGGADVLPRGVEGSLHSSEPLRLRVWINNKSRSLLEDRRKRRGKRSGRSWRERSLLQGMLGKTGSWMLKAKKDPMMPCLHSVCVCVRGWGGGRGGGVVAVLLLQY